MTYTNPTQVPGTFQSRPDSAPSKSYNCGPSSVVHVARFYRDRDFGIQETRRLAVTNAYRGTFPSERAEMLRKRGIPCRADRIGGSQLITLLRSRPVSVSMDMSKIPYPYRRYSFSGMHEITAVGVRSGVNGVAEVGFRDPNYGWPDGRTGYLPGVIWIPYDIWYPSFRSAGGWVVIPDAAKVITTRVRHVRKYEAKMAVNVRSGPRLSASRIATIPEGRIITTTLLEKDGGSYIGPGGATRKDWLAYTRQGRTVWVARAYMREVT